MAFGLSNHYVWDASSVVVDDKTDLTLVLPDGGYVKDDGNTVVRFVDRDTFLYSNFNIYFKR